MFYLIKKGWCNKHRKYFSIVTVSNIYIYSVNRKSYVHLELKKYEILMNLNLRCYCPLLFISLHQLFYFLALKKRNTYLCTQKHSHLHRNQSNKIYQTTAIFLHRKIIYIYSSTRYQRMRATGNPRLLPTLWQLCRFLPMFLQHQRLRSGQWWSHLHWYVTIDM